MSWPRLVPPALCTQPILLRLDGPPDENGAPTLAAEGRFDCRIRLKNAKCEGEVRHGQAGGSSGRRQLVAMAATAFFCGDIAPGIELLHGTATLFGRTWKIAAGQKFRDPDGRVNYTVLTLY